MKCLYLMLLCAFIVPMSANAQELSSRFKRKNFVFPQRDLSVIVGEDGFYPNHLVAFKGEKIRLFITSSSKKDSCFVLQKHEVFIAAENSVVNEAEFVADQSGRFRFYCPSSDFEGFPNSVVDAINYSVPVIATKSHGGIYEILGYGKNGFIFEVFICLFA